MRETADVLRRITSTPVRIVYNNPGSQQDRQSQNSLVIAVSNLVSLSRDRGPMIGISLCKASELW